ncbi:hypothetical protein A5689_15685 [Mycobacterium intracellulare subsp. yongonense]|nr:hypothetical protein A5689_15685 [Mycobacterium intracellulare subsp. yongonense]
MLAGGWPIATVASPECTASAQSRVKRRGTGDLGASCSIASIRFDRRRPGAGVFADAGHSDRDPGGSDVARFAIV